MYENMSDVRVESHADSWDSRAELGPTGLVALQWPGGQTLAQLAPGLHTYTHTRMDTHTRVNACTYTDACK